MSITNDAMEEMFRRWQHEGHGGNIAKHLSNWMEANAEALIAELRTVIDKHLDAGTYRIALPRMPTHVKKSVLAEYSSKYRIYDTYVDMTRWSRFVCKHRPQKKMHTMFGTIVEMNNSKALARKEQSNGKCVMCKKRKPAKRKAKCNQCLDAIWLDKLTDSGIEE